MDVFITITSVTGLWLLWITTITIWEVCFSDLSRVPGPKRAATTRLVLIYHKARGEAESWRCGLHRQYGDVVRVAPREVSIASGKVWSEIYGFAKGSKNERYEKDPSFYGRQGGQSLVSALPSNHGRQRRSFSHAFSDKALREQEPLIRQHVSQLILNLQSAGQNGTSIDLCKQYNFTAFDIMGDLAWGESLDCLRKSEYTPWISMIFSALKMITIFGELNHYPMLRVILNACIPKSLQQRRAQHLKYSADRVDRRLARVTTRPDIWSFVLAAKEDYQLSVSEMHANAGLFMVAGTEPIGTVLSVLTYHLLQNPESMKILTTEIRDTFGPTEEITIQTLLSLKYLNACIEEAFRICPPVPIGLPRLVPKGGREICVHFIPGGTSVYIHPLSTYHSERNFARPDKFLPKGGSHEIQPVKRSSAS